MDAPLLSSPDRALVDLLNRLEEAGYDFVTPSPATHARVVGRSGRLTGRTLRDILGWSLPFEAESAPPGLVAELEAAGALRRVEDGLKSAIRVSRLHGRLFVHSAYPTQETDAVFLGPDSYRFADLIAAELRADETGVVVDVGAGGGVGAILAAGRSPRADVLATDVNPLALRYARVNALHAGVNVRILQSDGLVEAPDGLSVVIANPPYMTDSQQTYRDGGDMHGARLSLAWARAALEKLSPGGRLVLYTGSAIVEGGRDELRAALQALAEASGAGFRYREIDPDVFGEELDEPAYADVERIAAVACVITAGDAD